MKSILSRLEALEAHNSGSILLQVNFADGTTKEMSVAEFKQIPHEEFSNLDTVKVISGNNRKEILAYTDRMREIIDYIVNHPVENRNIEDFE